MSEFDPGLGGSSRMQVNGFSCVLNLPHARDRRYDGHGNEIDQGLPEYAPRAAFSVGDGYTDLPQNWVVPGKNEAAYFVPVRAGRGLWLDFNRNGDHSHDVAVLISVQGVNAVTGQRTKGHGLEQYKHRCPVHNVAFGTNQYCPACGFNWPAQNYLATTGTPSGLFWLDGFRAEDGTTRQFVFTEEAAAGVAAQIIGSERVYAIAVQFYLSRSPKPVLEYHYRSMLGGGGMKNFGGLESFGATRGATRGMTEPSLEVGYGARIRQRVYLDQNGIDYWQPSPAGTIYIHYVTEQVCRQILASKRQSEGFLGSLQSAVPGPGNNKVF